jgi:hypothetical protein
VPGDRISAVGKFHSSWDENTYKEVNSSHTTEAHLGTDQGNRNCALSLVGPDSVLPVSLKQPVGETMPAMSA